MDSFEVNKLIGALAGNGFRRLLGRPCVRMRSLPRRVPEKPGFAIEAAEPAKRRRRRRRPPKPSRSPTLLATADAEAGAAVFKKCQACHTGEKGGPNKVGPNLWDIVNRPVASHEGFAYSAAHEGILPGRHGSWDLRPSQPLPHLAQGLRQGHGDGLCRPEEGRGTRQLIAYLRTLSDNPVPLPDAGRCRRRREAHPAKPAEAAHRPSPLTAPPSARRSRAALPHRLRRPSTAPGPMTKL